MGLGSGVSGKPRHPVEMSSIVDDCSTLPADVVSCVHSAMKVS